MSNEHTTETVGFPIPLPRQRNETAPGQVCRVCGSPGANRDSHFAGVAQLHREIDRARQLVLRRQRRHAIPLIEEGLSAAETERSASEVDSEGEDFRKWYAERYDRIEGELREIKAGLVSALGEKQQDDWRREYEQKKAEVDSWERKCAALKQKVGELQHETRRFVNDLDYKTAECEQIAQRLRTAEEILRLDEDSLRARLVARENELADKKCELQERQLEIELLERRLLEEDDVNWVWKYKYIGTL
ncbi:uncharacterized protein BJX67DRAFT_379842 [Aspergillus lucknowensis]|uniref:Uncharacterized protein n=1 Tax=Aspergillus lucknowensis TaxID=176173 RepID=A0ABR4LWX2_9EURO